MAQDGWKSGLSAAQLTKVEAIQSENERLQKEASQKKLMLENVEQELDRQKRKVNDCGAMSRCPFNFMVVGLGWGEKT